MTELLTAQEARELLKNNTKLDEYIKTNIMPVIMRSCNLGLNSCRYNLKSHIEANYHEFIGNELKLSNRLKSLGYITSYNSNYIERFMIINW